MRILGVDPGKKTGLAIIEATKYESCKFVWATVSDDPTGYDYTELIESVDVIVVENFRVRPGKARQGAFDWDPMIASQVIGALQLLGRQLKKPLHLQDASLKPMGYGWSNQKYVAGKKGTHSQDALAHAVYWAVKNGHALPVRVGK